MFCRPPRCRTTARQCRSEEHTSELQSPYDLVCRLLLEKKKIKSYPAAERASVILRLLVATRLTSSIVSVNQARLLVSMVTVIILVRSQKNSCTVCAVDA